MFLHKGQSAKYLLFFHRNDHDPARQRIFEPQRGACDLLNPLIPGQLLTPEPQRRYLPVLHDKRIGHGFKPQSGAGDVCLLPDEKQWPRNKKHHDRKT
jgi:hypothetical protein